MHIIKRLFAIAVAALALLGCSKKPMLFPLDGASTEDRAAIASIKEGSMLLRGLDGKAFDTSQLPNPISEYYFAVKPGSHVLWAMNLPGGNVYVMEGLRCYAFPPVTLEPGVVYRLDEDKELVVGVIKREDTGQKLATGRLIDRQAAFTDVCDWRKAQQ